MFLIVVVPLLGASAFAVYQVRQLSAKAAELSRMVDVIDVAVDVARFNILLGMEYSDSWNMYLSADAGNVYRQHIQESEDVAARIREKLQRINRSAYNANFTDNLDRALKAYAQAPAIRTYYLARRPGDDREKRTINQSTYREMQAPLGAAIRSLVTESNETRLRVRIQLLIWTSDLLKNATGEAGM